MKKAEFMKFIKDASKENLVQYMIDNGDYEVMETGEFVHAYADEPSSLASFIRNGELDLDCDYVRLGTYYSDAQEADNVEDLFTDEEVEDYFDDLANSLEDPEFDDILIEVEA